MVAKHLNVKVDVDIHPGGQRLLGILKNDSASLLALIQSSLPNIEKRFDVTVKCGGTEYTATVFTFYRGTNMRFKMTVSKVNPDAQKMYQYIAGKGGGGFTFNGRYTFDPMGTDTLVLTPPPNW